MPTSPGAGGRRPTGAAHIDEASTLLARGRRLYGVSAVLTSAEDHLAIAEALRPLVDGRRPFLHYYDETPARRIAIAEAVAELPLAGAIVLTETTDNREQERARAHLLGALLPRLQHAEAVEHVVVESRGTGDKHDRRTRDRLRQSRRITAELRLDWLPKRATPLVWLPDFVIGAYFSARFHDEDEPWKIIETAHVIEVEHLR